jgi:ribulose-bisphosphate carboxylase large chain
MNRLRATYRIRCPAGEVQARAQAIAIEQSVEMPLAGVRDPRILNDIVGRVEGVEQTGAGSFKVSIGLAAATAGPGIAQLMNMLFGNTSLHEDVELLDAEFPDELLGGFAGPRHGIAGLRRLTGVDRGPITCTALKPQGQSADELAALARRFALGGMHIIKDDHGISNQAYSPFEQRLHACQAAVRRANADSGLNALYAPMLSGSPSELLAQARLAREEGIRVVLVSPMLIGLPAFEELAARHLDPECAVLAHPALGGAARIAPELLFGKLFRLLGADAVIFTGYGGRFAYSPERCRAIANAMRAPWAQLKPAMPVPAGGMTLERVDELSDFYGEDTMLLIGGDLLIAGGATGAEGDPLQARTRAFADKVAGRSAEGKHGKAHA